MFCLCQSIAFNEIKFTLRHFEEGNMTLTSNTIASLIAMSFIVELNGSKLIIIFTYPFITKYIIIIRLNKLAKKIPLGSFLQLNHHNFNRF